MTKNDFLSELYRRLSTIPSEDRASSIEYYSEMINDKIEDGIPEPYAVAMLGDIDDIVNQIISDIPLHKLIKEKIGKRMENNTYLVRISRNRNSDYRLSFHRCAVACYWGMVYCHINVCSCYRIDCQRCLRYCRIFRSACIKLSGESISASGNISYFSRSGASCIPSCDVLLKAGGTCRQRNNSSCKKELFMKGAKQ